MISHAISRLILSCLGAICPPGEAMAASHMDVTGNRLLVFPFLCTIERAFPGGCGSKLLYGSFGHVVVITSILSERVVFVRRITHQ